MKIITVKSLLNEDKSLISESSYNSIKANGRMCTKIRISIENQLKHRFNNLIYSPALTNPKKSHKHQGIERF